VSVSVPSVPDDPVDDVVWLTFPEYVPSAGGLFLDGRALNWGRPLMLSLPEPELQLKETPRASDPRVFPQTDPRAPVEK
jgi:hypothetical protein